MRKAQLDLTLCYLTIFCYIVLGNAATFNLGNRLPIKVAEIVAIFTIFIIFFKNTVKIKVSKFNKKIFIWLIIGTLTLLFNFIKYNYSFEEAMYGFFYTVRIVYLIVLCMFIKFIFDKYNLEFKKILDFIINCFLLVCVIGFFQYIFYPRAYDFYNIFIKIGVYVPNPDPHVGRLISTFFDPNYLSVCLLIPASICLILWVKENNRIYFLKFLLIMLAILLTSSRSGVLGIAIILGLFIIQSIRRDDKKNFFIKKGVFLLVLFLLVCLPLLVYSGEVRAFNRVLQTGTDRSTYARFVSWKRGLSVIQDNPILGIGYNLTGIYYTKVQGLSIANSTGYGNDSSLLLVAMTTGIVGLVYFLSMIFKYLLHVLKLCKTNPLYFSLCAILFSALICSNFVNLLFYQLWLFPFLLIANIIQEN